MLSLKLSRLAVIQILALFATSEGVIPAFDRVIKDYNGRQILDSKRNYLVEWHVDWNNKTIEFTLTVNTVGWVGLGFSKDGLMKDADLVIAGVRDDGEPYISDMLADCHRKLRDDNKQDWTLLHSSEANGRTTLRISRLIDTCSSEDYPITDDLVHLLWAYGETDVQDYHHQERGSYKVYLLDPIMHPSPASHSLPRWRIAKRHQLLPKQTSYWCSIHKGPQLTRKHHIVQFHPLFENKVAESHTHHFVVYRCIAPPGMDPRSIFEPLVSYEGEECYLTNHNLIPIQLCRTIIYVWAIGGKSFILPDYVGFPIGTQPDEYFLLEMHYNNPEAFPGIVYESGVEAVYTDRLRPKEGGTLLLNYELTGFFMIPPGTQEFKLNSHCPSECTQTMGREGIDIFAIHSHTHGSGRKLKLKHIRHGNELPWVIKDDNYDYTIQIQRPLHQDRKVLPGDHLTLECTYDNTWTNTTTVAGYSFQDEMCVQVIYHASTTPFYSCSSYIPQEKLLRIVGVENVTWDFSTQERAVISPSIYRGLQLSDVTDFRTKWTSALRNATVLETMRSEQVVLCPTPATSLPTPQSETSMSYGLQILTGYTSPSSPPNFLTQSPAIDTKYFRVRFCNKN